MKKTLFLLLLLVSSCDYFEFKYHPWLILVESTYSDSKDASIRTTFKGHGFLIDVYGRSFVVTAAHLSQGGIAEKKPSLVLKYYDDEVSNFKKLKIKSRLAINRRDVEVIEIEKPSVSPLKPLASWIAPQHLGPSEYAQFPRGKLLIDKELSKDILEEKTVEPKGFVPLSLKAFLPETTQITPKLVTPHTGKSYSELIKISETTDSFLLRHRIHSSLELVKGEVFAETSIHAGMSGLPLILKTVNYDTLNNEAQALVGGLVSSGSRFFDNSWLTHEQHIGEAIMSLLLNAPPAEEVYWHCQEEVLYRKGTSKKQLQLNFQEALFVEREEKGDGERADGGDGERADGGNGERADGGDGERADGGSGTKSAVALKGGMGFSMGPINESPLKLNEISAFKIKVHGQTLLLPADMSTVNWLLDAFNEENASLNELVSVPSNGNLAESIWTRWKEKFSLPENSTYSELILIGEQLTPFDQYQKFAPKLTLRYDQSIFVKLDMGFDVIDFEVLKNGAIKNVTHEFQNIVTLQSASKKSYALDLSDMFMSAVSKIPYKKSLNSSGRIRFKVKDKDKEYLFWKNL